MNRQQFSLKIQEVLRQHIASPCLQTQGEELIRRIAWFNNQGMKSQKCISTNSLILQRFSVGKTSFKTEDLGQAFLRKPCCNQKGGDGRISGRP